MVTQHSECEVRYPLANHKSEEPPHLYDKPPPLTIQGAVARPFQCSVQPQLHVIYHVNSRYWSGQCNLPRYDPFHTKAYTKQSDLDKTNLHPNPIKHPENLRQK